MRAPFSAIEPFRRGVSIAMRGLAASTVARVCTCAGGAAWPGACGVVACPGAAGVCAGRGGGGGRGGLLLGLLLLQQRFLTLPLHLRPRDEVLPAKQHER